MTTIIMTIAYAFLGALIYSTLWALIAFRYQRYDVADICWGGGFIAATTAAWLYVGAPFDISVLMLMLITIWGVRLSWHVGTRWLRSTHEDPRYQAMRARWG